MGGVTPAMLTVMCSSADAIMPSSETCAHGDEAATKLYLQAVLTGARGARAAAAAVQVPRGAAVCGRCWHCPGVAVVAHGVAGAGAQAGVVLKPGPRLCVRRRRQLLRRRCYWRRRILLFGHWHAVVQKRGVALRRQQYGCVRADSAWRVTQVRARSRQRGVASAAIPTFRIGCWLHAGACAYCRPVSESEAEPPIP